MVILVVARRRLAVLLAVGFVAGLVGGALAAASRQPSARLPLSGHTIALDPGHGGIDSGATHPGSTLTEKEITLDVARRLARLLRQAGGRVVLTRTDDWESDLPNREELHRRAAIARRAKAEALLSLHVDAHADSSCQYGQVFYHPSSAAGKRLALALQAELLRLQPDNYRRAGPQDYFLLGCTDIPTVLVELGFISHPEERRLLNQERYREELARALLKGIVAYAAQPRSPSPPLGPPTPPGGPSPHPKAGPPARQP